jgi:hypothetical protein
MKVSRLLSPGDALTATAPAGLSFVESRPLGGAWLLDRVWRQLGIDKAITALVGGRRRDVDAERVVFALVAKRALWPSSKLAASEWVAHDVALPGLDAVSDDACYRALDDLLRIEARLSRQVYDATADLLNLEVDLLFFDTTSTYFELDEGDDGVWRDERGHVSTRAIRPRSSRLGFAPTARARTPATTYPRSWSAWPSRGPGFRCGCGAGRATPTTRR